MLNALQFILFPVSRRSLASPLYHIFYQAIQTNTKKLLVGLFSSSGRTFVSLSAVFKGRDFSHVKVDESAPPNVENIETFKGIKKEVLIAGDNKTFPADGMVVLLDYLCKFGKDNKIIDTTRGKHPEQMKIGNGPFPGWDRAVKTMSQGERALVVFGPDVAFGSEGFPPRIPADSVLVADIYLLRVVSEASEIENVDL